MSSDVKKHHHVLSVYSRSTAPQKLSFRRQHRTCSPCILLRLHANRLGVAAVDVRVVVPAHKKWCVCDICINTVVTRECCLQNLIRRRVLREEIIFYHSSGTSHLFVASRRRSSIIVILLVCSVMVMVDFTMGGLRVFHYTMSWISNWISCWISSWISCWMSCCVRVEWSLLFWMSRWMESFFALLFKIVRG